MSAPLYEREALEQFRDAIKAAGLVPPDVIQPDGEAHRFSSNGIPGDDSGWYRLNDGGVVDGEFGDDRSRLSWQWDADSGRTVERVEPLRPAACDRKASKPPTAGEPNVPDSNRPLPAASLTDFWALMTTHQYIYEPTGDTWPASSVNSQVPEQEDPETGKVISASRWIDRYRHVEQVTWAPGGPKIIDGQLISNGGWFEHAGSRVFNLYLPPPVHQGDAQRAGPWLGLIQRIYPDDWEHIVRWLAHRVQRPGEKINHALVLGGGMGIGKDTILEPVKRAIGSWNFQDVTPIHMQGRFNGFVKSVILRISEARDLGDVDRFGFYEHMKTYTAAPPDVLRCDEKNLREYYVPNVCGVVITTNHKTDGLYLPRDDRRHYVSWSEVTRDEFGADYWTELYTWYEAGGYGDVIAYLKAVDLSSFDAKAPPPQTPAFHDIVDANRAPEDAELADVLEALNNPDVVTLEMLANKAGIKWPAFQEWLTDRKNRRAIPHRLETAGFVPVRNESAKDGLWVMNGRRQAIYGRRTLDIRRRHLLASMLAASDQ